ncbi:MAG: dihydroorotate dehydrogenase electron transfer subunit [Eubacteriaceae bacterium]|nr:dihydroorotate dehydrogenase electron transfer subunit [Eubacteriaceae bacterium]
MHKVISQENIADGIFRITVDIINEARPGQFYMILPPGGAFSLRRPISVHDSTAFTASFLYQVKGRGTKAISLLKSGDELDLVGPLGNGFSFLAQDSVFVGGGLGIAPLFYAIKEFKRAYPGKTAACYLGFSGEAFLTKEYEEISDSFGYMQSGFITDIVEAGSNAYYACGPEAMLEALLKKAGREAHYLASFEARMGCGVGACYSCSIKTASGNVRVCTQGPVLSAKEVFYEQA